MAGIPWTVSVTGISLSATTVKTLLQIIAATNTRARISTIAVDVYGATAGTVNARVDISRQTVATGSPQTISKVRETDSETLQTTATKTVTGEPGTNTTLDGGYVNSIQGTFTRLYTEPEPLYVKGGGYLGVRVTCAAAATADIKITGEE